MGGVRWTFVTVFLAMVSTFLFTASAEAGRVQMILRVAPPESGDGAFSQGGSEQPPPPPPPPSSSSRPPPPRRFLSVQPQEQRPSLTFLPPAPSPFEASRPPLALLPADAVLPSRMPPSAFIETTPVDRRAQEQLRQLPMLGSIALVSPITVAKTLGLDAQVFTNRVDTTRVMLQENMAKTTTVAPTLLVVDALATVLAARTAAEAKPPTAQHLAPLVKKINILLTPEVIGAANGTSAKNLALAEVATGFITGATIDRKKVERVFPELGKVLKQTEEAVIKEGVFQRVLGRLPTSAAEWNVIKAVAYQQDVPVGLVKDKRVLARAEVVMQRYEKATGVSMSKLATVSDAAGKAQYEQVQRFIWAVATSATSLPLVKPARARKTPQRLPR